MNSTQQEAILHMSVFKNQNNARRWGCYLMDFWSCKFIKTWKNMLKMIIFNLCFKSLSFPAGNIAIIWASQVASTALFICNIICKISLPIISVMQLLEQNPVCGWILMMRSLNWIIDNQIFHEWIAWMRFLAEIHSRYLMNQDPHIQWVLFLFCAVFMNISPLKLFIFIWDTTKYFIIVKVVVASLQQ